MTTSDPRPGTTSIAEHSIPAHQTSHRASEVTETRQPVQRSASDDKQVQHHESNVSSPATTSASNDDDGSLTRTKTSSTTSQDKPTIWRRIYDTIYWVPPNCRYNPSAPPKFSIALNILFGFAGAFTVANLYYNHPILNILADEFNVSYAQVSQIPTLAQAGYAVGLLFLCPLGDMLPRRPFVLSLVFFTSTLCIALAATSSLRVFSAVQFITAVTTVTPQLMMPLVGDLAPPNRRAFALSIVTTGLMLGILLARLLSGVVTQYTSWRTIYWLSVGLQYLIFISLWLFMPDYPSTNQHLNYFHVLWSILVMLTKHPILVQACLVSFFTSATFTNFWTTLTFLLAGEPYNYTPVVIGLFALIGIAAMCVGPVYARFVTDRFVPLFTVLLGMCWCLLGVTIGTYTGTFTVAGPVIQALLNDFGMQTSQIANRSSIFTVEPKGRNRVNTAYMVFTFAGQLTGTSVGANLFENGGWVVSGSYSVASICVALLVTLSRGPWEEGWIGWHGGWSIWKRDRSSADGKPQQTGDQPQPFESMDEEKGEGNEHKDKHEHRHGRGDQEAANAVDVEKGLELRAAEDATSSIDDRGSSKSTEEKMSAGPESRPA
ncbi:putative major facilitator superfamily, MFS transporter superfamily [Septoria linicola]|nr:putative major facilitator superfamily, MFS transporter superfamily [Septoria linicola]